MQRCNFRGRRAVVLAVFDGGGAVPLARRASKPLLARIGARGTRAALRTPGNSVPTNEIIPGALAAALTIA